MRELKRRVGAMYRPPGDLHFAAWRSAYPRRADAATVLKPSGATQNKTANVTLGADKSLDEIHRLLEEREDERDNLYRETRDLEELLLKIDGDFDRRAEQAEKLLILYGQNLAGDTKQFDSQQTAQIEQVQSLNSTRDDLIKRTQALDKEFVTIEAELKAEEAEYKQQLSVQTQQKKDLETDIQSIATLLTELKKQRQEMKGGWVITEKGQAYLSPLFTDRPGRYVRQFQGNPDLFNAQLTGQTRNGRILEQEFQMTDIDALTVQVSDLPEFFKVLFRKLSESQKDKK